MFEWYWKPATVDMTKTFETTETFDMAAVDEGTFFIPDLIGAFDVKQAVKTIIRPRTIPAVYDIAPQVFEMRVRR